MHDNLVSEKTVIHKHYNVNLSSL